MPSTDTQQLRVLLKRSKLQSIATAHQKMEWGSLENCRSIVTSSFIVRKARFGTP